MLSRELVWLAAEAAGEVARLDEQVRVGPEGLGTLLMLRTARRIAKGAIPGDAESQFAALLGWWHAAESREFVPLADDVRDAALALDEVVEKLIAGRSLTPALLRESHRGVPADCEAVLGRAHAERWGGVQTAVALASSGDSVRHRIIRSAALLVGGSARQALLEIEWAADEAGALARLAEGARALRAKVDAYGAATRLAVLQCDEFGRAGTTARRLVQLLDAAPATTVVGASAALRVSVPAAAAGIGRLADAGVVREITGRGRDRVYVYAPAVALAG